uniref:Uncharacterized protein n=1 Tax=Rhodosorus marinus TaxID=101924 RepID=A0A7S2ZIL0_9RHOD|mmetsp:Transcript_20794/g.84659  ORF Transcript_20794/g.84659 Transcript_20794/m.84659 type:complete len:120 (+) Transcript_20794:146-505(+)
MFRFDRNQHFNNKTRLWRKSMFLFFLLSDERDQTEENKKKSKGESKNVSAPQTLLLEANPERKSRVEESFESDALEERRKGKDGLRLTPGRIFRPRLLRNKKLNSTTTKRLLFKTIPTD